MHCTYVQRLVYANRFNKHLIFKLYFKYLYILKEVLKKMYLYTSSKAKTCIPNKCFKNLKRTYYGFLEFVAFCKYTYAIAFEDKSM